MGLCDPPLFGELILQLRDPRSADGRRRVVNPKTIPGEASVRLAKLLVRVFEELDVSGHEGHRGCAEHCRGRAEAIAVKVHADQVMNRMLRSRRLAYERARGPGSVRNERARRQVLADHESTEFAREARGIARGAAAGISRQPYDKRMTGGRHGLQIPIESIPAVGPGIVVDPHEPRRLLIAGGEITYGKIPGQFAHPRGAVRAKEVLPRSFAEGLAWPVCRLRFNDHLAERSARSSSFRSPCTVMLHNAKRW
jgi:hypothetical protein